ncbi:MAG: transcription antitermination factor NusB [Actinomycetota bacterium]
MTEPAGDPRRVAIAAIVRIDDEGAYANVVLPRMLAESTLDGRDRGFATELVYGSTRMKRRLDHLVDRFLLEPPPPSARAALRIGAHQLLHLDTPPHAAVSATVAAAPKRFRGLVNAVLRKVATGVGEGVTFPSVATDLSYPDWIVERLQADLGADRGRLALETMNTAAGVHTRDDGYVQDPSSQAVAAAVPASVGDLVLDVCAAPGGKATALAQRGARVIAADRRFGRVGLITENRERLDLDDLHVAQADATTPPFAPETFDAVLVDAPCSGLGALRRRADARWRIQPDDVGELAALQRAILLATAPLVRTGGTLVYSVCTLTRAESTDVVAATAGALADLGFVADLPVPQRWEPYGTDTLVLVPGSDADGMALARWVRR